MDQDRNGDTTGIAPISRTCSIPNARPRASVSTKAERETPAGQNDVHTVHCLLRTASVLNQSHPSSPGLWPRSDNCYCWWARPNAAIAVDRSRWLRQAGKIAASSWLCADGEASVQATRTIFWAISKHHPTSACCLSVYIHFFFFPLWGTKSIVIAPRNLDDVEGKKMALHESVPKLLVQLRWSPSHIASVRFQLWCFLGIYSLHQRYETHFFRFLSSSPLDSGWYLDGNASRAREKDRGCHR